MLPVDDVLVPNVELGRQVAYMAELAAGGVAHRGIPETPPFSRCWERTRSSSNPRRRPRGARRRRRRSSVRFRRRPPFARARGGQEAAELAARARVPRTRKPPRRATPPRISRGVEPRATSPRKAAEGHSVKAGKKGSKLAGDQEVIPEFRRAEVLVATPARLLAMMRDGWVLPGRIAHVVVDEADEMLSRGFEREVAAVLETCYQDDGVNKFGGTVQFCFAAATMEEGPILGAFRRGADGLRWSQHRAFRRVASAAAPTRPGGSRRGGQARRAPARARRGQDPPRARLLLPAPRRRTRAPSTATRAATSP